MNNKENNLVPDEGVQLCMHCGLCCMGYFHKMARINNDTDKMLAQKMGASIEEESDGTRWFTLPCPKFDGKCSVYPERPSVCENHQCELLKSVKVEKISLEKAKSISDEMKKVCVLIDQELDTLFPHKNTRYINNYFQSLLTSDDTAKKTIPKNHPYLFLNHASYVLLRNRYFYYEVNDYMDEID